MPVNLSFWLKTFTGAARMWSYPLIFRLINLTRDGRHFLPGTPIDDGYLVSAEALGGSGGIHRCITAANDRYSLAQTDFISRIDPLQEIYRRQ